MSEFNDQQLAAIEAACEWYKNWMDGDRRKQVFFLAGFAGTGKTHIAKHISSITAGVTRTTFIAPTGKAASRLKQKGCYNAKTLHAFVYSPIGEDENHDPLFAEKDVLDERPSLVILDEASMVGEEHLNAVLRHGFPVLALGDIGQIPPVRAAQVFLPDSVDVLLDKIERQNADSRIIRASFHARNNEVLPFVEYDDVRVRRGTAPNDADILDHCGEDAVILCSYNTTRQTVNRRARALLGFSGQLPQPGEKIVCLFNQHQYGIMNGEQMIVEGYDEGYARVRNPEFRPGDALSPMYIEVPSTFVVGKSLTDGLVRRVLFNPECFTSADADEIRNAERSPGGFDFGYILTVHKSQGSEWENVMVISENLRTVPYAQMAYTAYTRAISRLTIYRR